MRTGVGFYRRSHARCALVGKDFPEMRRRVVPIRETPPEYIDYYGTLEKGTHPIEVGDTVIYAFRTQIFVTRSEVALVEGIQSGNPSLRAVYDSSGKKLAVKGEMAHGKQTGDRPHFGQPRSRGDG